MEPETLFHAKARRSSIFSVEHHPKDVGRSSISCVLDPHLSIAPSRPPKALYENTYKLEPDRKFDLKEAKALVDSILEENFSDVKYEPVKMSHHAKRVSTIIKDKMKNLGYKRFKFVCNVTVGQQENQGIKISSRFLWDAKRDNWINSTYCNRDLFAVASVYALYYE